MVNPHPELIVEVTEPNGQTSFWYVTAGNMKDFIEFGWTCDTLATGATITVEGFPPRREGTKALAGGKITKDDGSVLAFGLITEHNQ